MALPRSGQTEGRAVYFMDLCKNTAHLLEVSLLSGTPPPLAAFTPLVLPTLPPPFLFPPLSPSPAPHLLYPIVHYVDVNNLARD